jgi:transcriptional regulator with XRE-family HTH domain
MSAYDTFADILSEKGLTPYKVAKATGINPSTLSSWKRGVYRPKYDKLKKIADYLDIDVWEITDMDQIEKDKALYEAALHEEVQASIPKDMAVIYKQLSYEKCNKLIDYGKNLVEGKETISSQAPGLTMQEKELLDIFRNLSNKDELLRYARYLKDGEKEAGKSGIEVG